MLEVKGLAMAYGEKTLFTDFDLEVEAGEIVALCGPSGSGKSTLLRCIAGLANPDAGQIRVEGEDIVERPPEARGVGMVFQSLALFPHLDAGGNLRFGLPKGGDPARIAEMLEAVDLAGFESRRIDNLSGGEAQRVALARALVAEPKVMLLDEPLSSLDAALKMELAAAVRSILKSAGVATIHVTHDAAVADVLADRVIHL